MTIADEYPLAKVSQDLSNLATLSRNTLGQCIEGIFQRVNLNAADDAGKIMWQWSLTLAVLVYDVSVSAHLLVLHDQLRGAIILNRCLFEYWLRMEYYHLNPSKAIEDHQAMDDQTRRFVKLLGAGTVLANIAPKDRAKFEVFMEQNSKAPRHRNVRTMLDAVIKNKQEADEFYAMNYVLGSVYIHGNEVAAQDVFTEENAGTALGMNWNSNRIDPTTLLMSITRFLIYTIARLENAWSLEPTFMQLEAALHGLASPPQVI